MKKKNTHSNTNCDREAWKHFTQCVWEKESHAVNHHWNVTSHRNQRKPVQNKVSNGWWEKKQHTWKCLINTHSHSSHKIHMKIMFFLFSFYGYVMKTYIVQYITIYINRMLYNIDTDLVVCSAFWGAFLF